MFGRSTFGSSGGGGSDHLPALAASPLTPPRLGGIATIIVWGRDAGRFMRTLFTGIEPGMLTYRRLTDGDQAVDEVLALLVPVEDAVSGGEEGEISLHGGRLAREAVLALLEARGAAVRAPEALVRASPKLDAIQREASQALVNAATREQVAFLLRQLRGELSHAVAAIEATVGEPDRITRIDELLNQAAVGLALVQGARILVAGPPNAGKSTLVNRLCAMRRSIVTDVPGTTRDILEAAAEFNGIPVTVLDSGGLSETGTRLERLGTERTLAAISDVHVVLCLGVEPETLPVRPKAWIRLGPKADLGGDVPPGVLPVSGLTGLGIDALKERVSETLRAGGDWLRPAPFTDRQDALLREARAASARGNGEAAVAALRRVLHGASYVR